MTRFKKQFVTLSEYLPAIRSFIDLGWEVWEYDGDGVWLIQELV